MSENSGVAANSWVNIRPGAAHYLVLTCIISASIAIRLAYVNLPIRFDEAFTHNQFASTGFSSIFANYDHVNNHPLNSYLVAIAVSMFGSGEWVIRLPALLAGLALTGAIYLVTRSLYNDRVALIATALTGASYPLIQFSTNGRGYSLLTLATVLMVGAGARAKQRNRPIDWALLCICILIAEISIPLHFYSSATILLWLLLSVSLEYVGEERRVRLRRLFVCGGGSLIVLIVFFSPAAFQAEISSFFASHLQGDPADIPLTFEDIGEIPRSVMAYLNAETLAIVGTSLIAAMSVGAVTHERFGEGVVPVLLPAVLIAVASALVRGEIQTGRVWIYLAPLYFITVGAGVVYIVDLLAKNRPYALNSMAILLFVVPAATVLNSRAVQLTDETGYAPEASQAARLIADQVTPGDEILLIDPHSEILRYYLNRYGLEYDPIVHTQMVPYTLEIADHDVYTFHAIDLDLGRAIDYIDLQSANLHVDVETIQQFESDILQQVIARFTEPATSNVRRALFSDNFEDDNLDDWLVNRDTTSIVNQGGNRILDIRSGDSWDDITLRESSMWIDYSMSARIRVVDDGSEFDDVFFNVRHLEPIGNYSGSVNLARAVGAISGDLDRAWRGPLTPVGVLPAEIDNADWHDMRVRVAGDTIELFLNGQRVVRAKDKEIPRGSIRILVPPNHHIQIDDIVVIEEVDRALPLVYALDFETGNIRNWQYDSGEASITASDDSLSLSVGSADWAHIKLRDSEHWRDIAFEARIQIVEPVDGLPDAMIMLRHEADIGNYSMVLDSETDSIALGRDQAGIWQGIFDASEQEIEPGQWYDLRMQVIDDSLSVFLGEIRLIRTIDSRLESGGVMITVPPGGRVLLDDVRISATDGASDPQG